VDEFWPVAEGVPCHGRSLATSLRRIAQRQFMSAASRMNRRPGRSPNLTRDPAAAINKPPIALLITRAAARSSGLDAETAWGGRDSIDHGTDSMMTFLNKMRWVLHHAPLERCYNLEVLAGVMGALGKVGLDDPRGRRAPSRTAYPELRSSSRADPRDGWKRDIVETWGTASARALRKRPLHQQVSPALEEHFIVALQQTQPRSSLRYI